MNEERLVQLLTQHFMTKEDFYAEISPLKENVVEIKDSVADLTSSAKALDSILEQHPIPRIERLEQHTKLPPYVPVLAED